MMNIKKLTSALLVAVIILTSLFSSFAKENEEKAKIKLLSVFGDTLLTIAPADVGENEKGQSSIDKLAEYYALEREVSLVDLSVSGGTAKSVLKALSDKKNANEEMKSALKASDTLLLSVGSVDALDFLLPLVSEMLGLDPVKTTVKEITDTLTGMKDKELDAFVKKTKSFAKDNKEAIDDFCESFSKDYADLLNVMKENGKNAQIYLFTICDPISEMPDYLSLASLDSNVVSPILEKLNGVIKKQTDALNVHLVDTYTEFSLKRRACTFVSDDSLALSEYGHTVIASAMTYEIDEVYRTMKNGDSEPLFENGKNIWIWFAAAVEMLVIVVFVTVICVKKMNSITDKKKTVEEPKK